MLRTDEEVAGLRSGLATEIRTSLYQEVQTNIQERISQVSLLVQEYETKSKDVGQMLKEDYRKEMSSIETQLNTIYQEYEKMEKTLEEYRTGYSNDWVELSKATKSNEDNIAKTDEKMNAIMEQANSLMINDARQDEALGKLEGRVRSVEEKHVSLEEADVFLQQAQRQITEKTSALETLMNLRHDELDQKTSSALISLDARQESLSSGLDSVESQLGLMGDRMEAMEKISEEIQAKLALEIEKLDKVEAEFGSQLSDFQEVGQNIQLLLINQLII